MKKNILCLGVLTGITLYLLIGDATLSLATPFGSLIPAKQSAMPWWGWPLILFFFTFILGVLAILGGIGGSVLFVPLVSGLFPFHFDFVRGTGLVICLIGGLTAGPYLLKEGLGSLRLVMPLALISSLFSIIGALMGLSLPTDMLMLALGITILITVGIMIKSEKSLFPEVSKPDFISSALKLVGSYSERSLNREISWKVHKTPVAFIVFALIGMISGLFGIGGGWANVLALNLIMGVPLKVAVATSGLIISIAGTSAAWIYFNKGAVLPLLVAPAVLGMMLGTMLGAKILTKIRPESVRRIVIGLLFFAGIKAVWQGI